MKTYFLTILTGLFIFTACNGDDDNAPESFVPQEIDSELVAKYNNLFCIDGEYCILEQYTVFYNNTHWNTLLSQLHPQPLSYFEETEIDFDTFMVVAAIDKMYTHGIQAIDIISITEYEDKMIVNVQKHIQNATGVLNQPFHIVKIPKSDKPVEFVVAEP